MHLTDHADFFPGACFLTREPTKLIDLERTVPNDPHNSRAYLSQQLVADCARMMGFKGPEEIEAAHAKARRLEQENVDLRFKLEEADALRRSVAYTLKNGAVANRTTGEVDLRAVPGTKKVDLKKELTKA
jgi:hypothetical protein